ncbi:MAG TPA: polyphosphate kinase [Porticoccaceae bacterium]|nr:polyphosphate kinase [Porticoccaceae bacterium]
MSRSAPKLSKVDLSLRLPDAETYQDRLKDLQTRLQRLQSACYHNRQRAVIVLEGWDAGGKGGAIRRMTEKLDPRSYRVHAIGAPNDQERDQHYLQRFWNKVPHHGHIAIFDRSWYGRVLVERVEGLADKNRWQQAYDEINEFERQLHDDGVVIVKLMLHISQEEQLRRFAERLDNPRKHWKLTPEDLRNRARAKEYREAYQDMLDRTHRPHAPWTLIAGDHKWHARTAALDAVVTALEAVIDPHLPRLTSSEIRDARKALGLD